MQKPINVLELEQAFNASFTPLATAEPGTFAFNNSYGMMAFAIGFVDYITHQAKVLNADLLAVVKANTLNQVQQLGIRGESFTVARCEYLQELFKQHPLARDVLTEDLYQKATLFGLHAVAQIDASTIPWAGAVPGQVAKFTNPIQVVSKMMSMVAETLTLAKGSVWQHAEGDYYQIIGGTNQASDDQVRFPTTVVYTDTERNVWSRPLDAFLQRFEHRYTMYDPTPDATVAIIN